MPSFSANLGLLCMPHPGTEGTVPPSALGGTNYCKQVKVKSLKAGKPYVAQLYFLPLFFLI